MKERIRNALWAKYRNYFTSLGSDITIGAALGLVIGAAITYAMGRVELANMLGLFVLYFLTAGIILRIVGHFWSPGEDENKDR